CFRSLQHPPPRLALEARKVGDAAVAHQREAGLRVDRHLRAAAVGVAEGDQQFGGAVVAGGDLRTDDDRFLPHPNGGSTKTTSLPSSSPAGLRSRKMCRFQLASFSVPSFAGRSGSTRAASVSRVSPGSGVTKRRWRDRRTAGAI